MIQIEEGLHRSRNTGEDVTGPQGSNSLSRENSLQQELCVITDIATINIYVRDQDAALDFYKNKLGFEVRADRPAGKYRWIEVAPPGATTTIVLGTPAYETGSEAKVGGFSEIQLWTDDIQKTHAELVSRGVTFTYNPELMPWGKWHSRFVDPDGNEFFLIQHGKGK
jgi:catechol 2,3-dioxygenase-like lactoylglutathione lyase family enzyme